VKQQVIAGDLDEGTSLPSIRALARDLQVSVITTKRAYEELEREGFIDTVGGKGTFVAVQNEGFLREKRLRAVEEKLAEAVANARMLGIGRDELGEMLRLLCEEES
jgi:GntR family transcriptional regulator